MLAGGGDGVEVADLTFLRILCLKYPHLRVLATVLSSANQVKTHSTAGEYSLLSRSSRMSKLQTELAVLAQMLSLVPLG